MIIIYFVPCIYPVLPHMFNITTTAADKCRTNCTQTVYVGLKFFYFYIQRQNKNGKMFALIVHSSKCSGII